MKNIVSFKRWSDAGELLNAQLDLLIHKNNKHFKTLSFSYYSQIRQLSSEIASADYHALTVSSGLFYGLRNEFSILSYLKPKSSFGLRNYRFLSYPMRCLYYSVGLYIVSLTQEFLDCYYQKKKAIKSFYGAKIRYKGTKLDLTKNGLLFYADYKRFRNLLKDESKLKQNRLVVKIDIQNYYDNISIPRMLTLIEKFTKQSEQQKHLYTVETQTDLRTFFEFISKGGHGIPQSDNDPISSFLGHLYLVFGDLLLDDELISYTSILKRHQIIRYMDDTYVVLDFEDGLTKNSQRLFVMSLLEKISDSYFVHLGLKLNEKTRLYWLDTQDEVDHLLESIKRISKRSLPVKWQVTEEPPEELSTAIENLLTALKQLADHSYCEIGKAEVSCNRESLKEIFDKRVSQLLERSDNLERLKLVLGELNWDLVKLAPQELTLVLLKCTELIPSYTEYLTSKTDLSTRDIELIITFMCHSEETMPELLEKLKSHAHMKQIAEQICSPEMIAKDAGYFGLNRTQLAKIAKMELVLEQIKLRRLSEDVQRYSVALNHLVNEFQCICKFIDPVLLAGNSDADSIVLFLSNKGIFHNLAIRIRNMFDRRNLNQISHAGTEDEQPSWGVSGAEYNDYRKAVRECLCKLL